MSVTRRSFLQSAGVGATLAQNSSAQAIRAAGMQLPAASLPVLKTADIAVIGNGFAAVAAALSFARAGRRTALIDSRTYLGREIGAHLRPWLPATRTAELPAVIRSCSDSISSDSETPLHMDRVKVAVEDMVLGAGIDLLYASFPIGICAEGLVIANKSGRQVIRCEAIVDGTETSVVARMAGATFAAAPGRARYLRTIEYDEVGPISETEIRVPSELGIVSDRITLHRGYRSPAHFLVEFGMELPVGTFDYRSWMAREIEARKRTFRLAPWLTANHPAFSKAYLAHTSYELFGPATAAMTGSAPGAGRSLEAFATPVRGIWCLEAARLSDHQNARHSGPVGRALLGELFADALLRAGASASRQGPFVLATPDARPAPTDDLEIRELPAPQPGRNYSFVDVQATVVPLIRESDVLVVGGGTSGATAAAVAAREGVRTIVTEMNPGLGGTGTIAGVDSYWFGRRVGYAARVSDRLAEVHKSIGLPEGKGRHDKWNIEAKMFSLLREADGADAEICLRTTTFATVVERGNRVRGVMAATPYGLECMLARVVIDASGDGDVAAFAGGEFVCQSAMDHIGMWHNFAQFVKPGKNTNHFTSSVEISNIEDCTRAILAGRRRGTNCHDHGIYLAPRETRHISGDVTLTLTDSLRHRGWPDVIGIHYGNSDMKGKSTSQWLYTGLIPPNLETEISYRMLIPKGLENILIAGKAFSATHDGLAGARFQADLENLGAVVALAAAKAVKENRTPRNIDVGELQRRLVADGVLPETILTRTLKPRQYSDRDLRSLVKAMLSDMPLLGYQESYADEPLRKAIPFVEVCTAGPRVVPILVEALNQKPSRPLLVAQALAMCGSNAGVPLLIEAIERSLTAADRLPPRTKAINHANVPPDQGAMSDTAFLLYNLGMTRDRRALPVWERVAHLLKPTPEQFRSRTESPFHYVDAVCYGAERLGATEAVPILEKLHSHDMLRSQGTKKGFQPDHLVERQAMLELAIARALARCGSAAGYELLIGYLTDNRAALAEQAHINLTRITGLDFAKQPQAWTKWLEEHRGALTSQPLTADLDAWYETEILTRL